MENKENFKKDNRWEPRPLVLVEELVLVPKI